MSNSKSDTLFFGHEAPNEDTPGDVAEIEGDSSSSSSSSSESSSSESESEPQGGPESEDDEESSSQLHVEIAEWPVRSGSFVSHTGPRERFVPLQHFS
jgi:hypothetical protein